MDQRVLVASNRGPVSFSFGESPGGPLTARRGGGGMIAGLMSGLAGLGPDTDVTWICAALSDADRAAVAAGAVPEPGDQLGVVMLDIDAGTFGRAYNGVANSVLWFLHHMLFNTPEEPRFEFAFDVDWASYVLYNELFAQALAGARPGATLIQDYHLALAPRLLRDLAPGRRIAHFSHTPWAPSAYYRMLPRPVGEAILDGMLGADHAGFLAPRWAEAFLDCCADILGAEVTRGPGGGLAGRVRHRGRVTQVAVHPLGVDAQELRAQAADAGVAAHAAAFGELTAGGRQLIVRVDRTELSKNITGGLTAYRELLTRWPQWRGRVVHLVFAYPSRSELPAYRAYTERVTELAAAITEEFATPDWNPLLVELKDDYPRSLAALRAADVLLINPIRDGMNLVAQEGPVLSGRGCGLVLSREAGAAAVLGDDALLVNPYDAGETALALHRALQMPAEERKRRTAALTAAAQAHAPARWLGDQVAALRP